LIELYNVLVHFCLSEDEVSPINKEFIELYLLFELAMEWKNLVLLSPSFNHITLDFCLQLTSSIREHLSNCLTTSAFYNSSSSPKAHFLQQHRKLEDLK